GEVVNFAALPVAAPANDGQVYLVQNSTGLLITFNLKRSGLYQSNGSTWTKLSEVQQMFKDADLVFQDDADNTKQLQYQLSSISTGTIRTATWQDKDGTVAYISDTLKTKAGVVLNAGFTGNPKTATITFGTAFADANYSPTFQPNTTNNKSFKADIENITASSFDVNLHVNNISDLVDVRWVAIKHGET
ncbi:unnamed protein product, partial [marine sediment metagenome]